jgi:predicted peptidase
VPTRSLPRRPPAALALCLLACGGGAARPAPAPRAEQAAAGGDSAAFAAAAFTGADGTRIVYRLLAPARPVAGRRYPLVLQLHGSGGIGADNAAQLDRFARGWARPATRAGFPAYVLVPQFPGRSAAYGVDPQGEGLRVSRPLPPLAAALELADSLRRALPVDTTRVYAVGFSMGGSTAWHALLLRPTLFAAAVAVAGVPPEAAAVLRVPRVPLLLLHGTADTENAYAGTRAAHAALQRAGRAEVELRAYPELGHAVPPDVLAGDWWRAWLFRQHR